LSVRLNALTLAMEKDMPVLSVTTAKRLAASASRFFKAVIAGLTPAGYSMTRQGRMDPAYVRIRPRRPY